MHSTGLAGEYRRSAVQDKRLPKRGMKKLFRTAMPQLVTTPAIYRPPRKGKRQMRAGDVPQLIIIVGTTALYFLSSVQEK